MKIVIIGRFQPLHLGHMALFQAAFSCQSLNPSYEIHVVLGSSHHLVTIKNPFTSLERETFIKKTFPQQKLNFIYQRDYHDDKKWRDSLIKQLGVDVILVYFAKDSSSYYLNLFPEWQLLKVDAVNNFAATNIRNLLFSQNSYDRKIFEMLPSSVFEFLQEWKNSINYSLLTDEYNYYQNYNLTKNFTSNNINSVTTNNSNYCIFEIILLIVVDNKILIEKKSQLPSKNAYSLPLVELQKEENINSAIARAIKQIGKENSAIDKLVSLLKTNLISAKLRDYPSRVIGRRSIAQVNYYQLDSIDYQLINDNYFYFDLRQFTENEENIYADHFLIVADTLQLWEQIS